MQNEFEKRLARINARQAILSPAPVSPVKTPERDTANAPSVAGRIANYMLRETITRVILPGAAFLGLMGYASMPDSDAPQSEFALSNLISVSDLWSPDSGMMREIQMGIMLFKFENGFISDEEMAVWAVEVGEMREEELKSHGIRLQQAMQKPAN